MRTLLDMGDRDWKILIFFSLKTIFDTHPKLNDFLLLLLHSKNHHFNQTKIDRFRASAIKIEVKILFFKYIY